MRDSDCIYRVQKGSEYERFGGMSANGLKKSDLELGSVQRESVNLFTAT
jgi:hypothetical protein